MTTPTACRAMSRWSCGRRAAPGSPASRARKAVWPLTQLADLVVLSKDYFSVAEEEIKGIESVLTVVDGKVVYAASLLAAGAAADPGAAGVVAGGEGPGPLPFRSAGDG